MVLSFETLQHVLARGDAEEGGGCKVRREDMALCGLPFRRERDVSGDVGALPAGQYVLVPLTYGRADVRGGGSYAVRLYAAGGACEVEALPRVRSALAAATSAEAGWAEGREAEAEVEQEAREEREEVGGLWWDGTERPDDESRRRRSREAVLEEEGQRRQRKHERQAARLMAARLDEQCDAMQEQWRSAVAPQLLTSVDDRATRLALALQSGHGVQPRQELGRDAVLPLGELGQRIALNGSPPPMRAGRDASPPSTPHKAHGDHGAPVLVRPRGTHPPSPPHAARVAAARRHTLEASQLRLEASQLRAAAAPLATSVSARSEATMRAATQRAELRDAQAEVRLRIASAYTHFSIPLRR
jgi:hypothetical protein